MRHYKVSFTVSDDGKGENPEGCKEEKDYLSLPVIIQQSYP